MCIPEDEGGWGDAIAAVVLVVTLCLAVLVVGVLA